jgi:hypothetical protein
MIRGQIPVTWDMNIIKMFDYTSKQYESYDTNSIRFVDDINFDRYPKIGFSMCHDVWINYPDQFEFINTHFRWLKNKHPTIHKISPGEIVPLHTDRYKYYNQKYDIVDDNDIFRLVIFMEDWKSGHYLEVENNGFTNWKAGDWVGWDMTASHLAANIGSTDRYTLQITGTKY